MSDIYVVVAENPHDPMNMIVFEQYVDKASKEEAKAFIKKLGGEYGKCRIAKLTFEVDDE